jgi:tetratricopeptide (TPR) repeat protein
LLYYESAAFTFQNIGDYSNYVRAVSNSAVLLYNSGQTISAIKLLEGVLNNFKPYLDTRLQVNTYINPAETHSSIRNFDEAYRYLHQALPLVKSNSLPNKELTLYAEFGHYFMQDETYNIDSALYLLELKPKAYDQARPGVQANYLNAKAKANNAFCRHRKALEFANDALIIGKENDIKMVMMNSLQEKHVALAGIKQFQDAYQIIVKKQALTDQYKKHQIRTFDQDSLWAIKAPNRYSASNPNGGSSIQLSIFSLVIIFSILILCVILFWLFKSKQMKEDAKQDFINKPEEIEKLLQERTFYQIANGLYNIVGIIDLNEQFKFINKVSKKRVGTKFKSRKIYVHDILTEKSYVAFKQGLENLDENGSWTGNLEGINLATEEVFLVKTQVIRLVDSELQTIGYAMHGIDLKKIKDSN